MRTVGLIYLAYFVLSIVAGALRNVPLEVVATALYFVLALSLYRLFAPADPRIALLTLPLAAAGCAIQGIGQIQADAVLLRAALFPFALFLVVLGYLVVRSTFAPRAIGVLLALAGIAWSLLVVVPGMPSWYSIPTLILGISAEGVLAIWLLVARDVRALGNGRASAAP